MRAKDNYKYLSAGCGHTTRLVKLAHVGGPTPEPSLATYNGMINVGKLKRNLEFKAMTDNGVDIDSSACNYWP